ncbi:longevity assurance proteins LAG1/LAC1 [Hyaloscypha bicolor E]|uniref:Longevity assurance proteins LAG1/LAC1 n=1 Tax=Hyaloscypha bicolor E TaxID=1095630 RepID=A0A2J6TJX5_9HELO|nr:longevity assurance proteins LAG1/LAC1 [Hyaloscypha bicolor E]PMD63312.1 longevity assurance proteins LAG1/LAC1 [Hyaloscypha bicolor E]
MAQEWIDQNDENANGLRKKLNDDVSQVFPARTVVIDRKAKRKDDGPLEIFCGWIVEHQIGLSVNLLMLLCLTHLCFPRARRHTRKFFELSYYNPDSGEYCAGWNDAWMVFYWIVVFTGLRAAVMDYLLTPFAKKAGAKTERDQTRFAEQAWLLIYYSVFWTLGMYILVNSDYLFNFKNLWTNWPNREISGVRKWYILVQYAFWLQQIFVINIEKRRKDHWQMFTHHIVTTFLIFTSYGYHQTKVANLILCIMDVVDLIFPLAKCLKYLGFTTICDIIFGVFMVVWIAARHVTYMMICWSLYHDLPMEVTYGCYSGRNGAIKGPFEAPDGFWHLLEPFRDPEGVVCWNDNIKWGFLGALLFLQCITLLWFWMIVQVAVKVVKGGEADDVRSDDEGEEELEEHEAIEEELLPYEEEVGVESINLKGKVSNASKMRYKKSASSATGVSLPGHSDRKELLGRIGCDKGV